MFCRIAPCSFNLFLSLLSMSSQVNYLCPTVPAWEVSGWTSPGSVEAGGTVTLTCETSSSVPPSTLDWSSPGGTPPLGHATDTHSPGLYGGTVTR